MVIGVWAYLDNNIGDDLMIKLLAENFQEHTFLLYSDKTVVKNTFRDFTNIVVKSLKEMNDDIEQMKVFISIGGSIFNNLNTLKGKVSRLKRIWFINKLKRKKIKLATIGCNLGPYSDKIGPFLTKVELRKNDLITVRDKESFTLLESFKSIDNYHLADDIVYLLDKRKFTERDDSLGITAYRSLKQDECNYDNYLVLSKMVDQYIERTGKEVKLFAFDSENENDLSAAHHIWDLSKNKQKVRIIPYLGDIERFLKEFSSCDRHIAIRFHGAILSDLFGIPFLPIVYSNKMLNFLNDNEHKGDIIMLKDLKMSNINVEEIVKKLISREALFYSKNSSKKSKSHFAELRNLINQ